jgi:hypothetical protein
LRPRRAASTGCEWPDGSTSQSGRRVTTSRFNAGLFDGDQSIAGDRAVAVSIDIAGRASITGGTGVTRGPGIAGCHVGRP